MTDRDKMDITPSDAEMDALLRRFADEASQEQAERGASFQQRMRGALHQAAMEERQRPEGRPSSRPARIESVSPRRNRIYPLAAAAALLIGVAAYFVLSGGGSEEGLGELVLAQGGVEVLPGEGGAVSVSSASDSGFVYRLDAGRIQLFGTENTELRIMEEERVFLEQGEVLAVVEENSGDFAVETSHGRAEVLGTVFGVETGPDEMQVYVDRGSVRVVNSSGSIELPGREQGRAMKGSPPEKLPAQAEVPPWAWELLDNAEGIDLGDYYPSVVH